MSLSRSWLVVFVLTSGLAACGFEPALRDNPTSAAFNEGFAIEVAGGRTGFILEEFLQQRLGTPGHPNYQLRVRVYVTERTESVAGAGGIDRFALDGVAHYDIGLPGAVSAGASGTIRGSASYSSGSGEMASGAARGDAEKRMLAQIADRLVAQLILTSSEWAG